jgi:isovaleryl-CoA dehydrogenase
MMLRRSLSTQAINLFNPTPEIQSLRQSVRAFAQEQIAPGAKARDAEEKFDMSLFKKCGDMGLLGVTVPEQFGGSGMDALAACVIHEELGAVDQGFCLSYLAHSMLFTNNLARNGNDEQKTKYLPTACDGTKIGGMCMSEASHGTDVLGSQTRAKRNANGDWVINGRKFWITNGTLDDSKTPGDVFLVYAKTGEKDTDMSLFLVEKQTLGFSVGQRIKNKCGMRASPTAELVFDNCTVKQSALVGKENKAVACMMRNLEIERVTLAAMSCGLARTCLDTMNTYATERIAFKKPIREFGQVQKHLSESYAQLMAARTYLYYVASQMDLDRDGNQRLDTDGVKLICTTMGKQVADNAIQVLGGAGYIADYPVERLWRDSKLLEIGGGTLESHQKNMTREMKNVENMRALFD